MAVTNYHKLNTTNLEQYKFIILQFCGSEITQVSLANVRDYTLFITRFLTLSMGSCMKIMIKMNKIGGHIFFNISNDGELFIFKGNQIKDNQLLHSFSLTFQMVMQWSVSVWVKYYEIFLQFQDSQSSPCTPEVIMESSIGYVEDNLK